MSELTNIHARSVKDLTTPSNPPADLSVFDQVKLVAGNFPPEYAGNEALTVGLVKELAAQGREAELEEVFQKITQKADKTDVDATLSTKASQDTTYSKVEVDYALALKAPQSNTYTKAEVDTTFAAYVGGRKAYTTLALAQAEQSSLPINTSIEITNDGANNGTYHWNGTTLTKSAYDPLTQAKGYADQQIIDKVLKYIKTSGNVNNVFILFDLLGNALLRIEENAELFLYSDSESIQAKFQRIFSELTELSNISLYLNKRDTTDLVRITDSLGSPLLRFDENADAYLSGFTESIQSMLKKINVQPEVVKPLRALNRDYLDKKFLFNNTFVERLNNAKATHVTTAPVPTFATLQKFSISTTWVNDVVLSVLNPEDRVQMSGYEPVFNEDIGVVHPQVWVFNEAVAGYKYWLGINPYTNGNEKIELPFIYGSNDPEFRTWELIPDFPTPFEHDPIEIPSVFRGHLSDSGFTYDVKTGEFIFFWRKNIYHLDGSHPDQIGVQGSRFNGKEWSENHQIYGLRNNPDNGIAEGLMSPNIVYNPQDDLYYMYSCQSGKLWYRTSPDLTGDYWSARTECVLNHHAGSLWHLDAKLIGDKLVILLHQDNFMSASTDALYFAASSDFVNFNVSANSILTEVDPPIYKATFQPIFTGENTARFRVIYTSDSRTSPQYQMYVTDTNEINFGA